MMIMLRFGFAHTITHNKDSKFHGTFKQTCDLLQLNTHTVSSENHDPMLVERIGQFLNKGLKIFKGEHGIPATSREGALTLMYAWNSAPIPLTNISRSMVVTGQNFSFPIDLLADKAVWLTGTKRWAESYAADQARPLLHSREISYLLIAETQSFHREHMNDLRPDPTQHAIGDKVLAHRSVYSDKAKNRVDC